MISQEHILRRCPTSTEILEFLLHVPYEYLEAERLIKIALNINIGRKEVEQLESQAQKMWDAAGSPKRGTMSMTR